MNEFSYKTIEKPTDAKLTEKNSRFLAFAYEVNSENEVAKHLEHLKDEHPKASHWCYAWRLGLDKHYYRANDDGEPSGSAGRPILGQIDSASLTNVVVIVVRYYGGVNLGVSGLIKAYKQSAQMALDEATIVTRHIKVTHKIEVEYKDVNDFRAFLNNFPVAIIQEEYTNTTGIYTLEFEKNIEGELLPQLEEFEVKS